MAETVKRRSGISRRWHAMSIGSRISIVVLVLVALVAICANFLAPHSPFEIFKSRQAPNGEFLFGTDEKGRDILSRMMFLSLIHI